MRSFFSRDRCTQPSAREARARTPNNVASSLGVAVVSRSVAAEDAPTPTPVQPAADEVVEIKVEAPAPEPAVEVKKEEPQPAPAKKACCVVC